tara:strand:+ start:752 stop:922 length:171 start_codon:yes stop_codon:yes gene_type:complete
MEFNKELLKIIVCPLSKERLIYDEKNNRLIAKMSKLAYPVKNGIPIMIPEEAKKID